MTPSTTGPDVVAVPPASADRASPGWREVDWPSHQRWVTVAGGPLNVIELGEGPPVLFVHGLCGSWQNWLEQLPAFAREHRVIAVDLPGFGRSAMPGERISIAGYARIVDELCATLGIDAATVVGNSMGGFIAAELALISPPRVERLVLVAPAGISIVDQRPLFVMARRAQRFVGAYGAWIALHADTVVRRRRLREQVLGSVFAHPERLPTSLLVQQLGSAGSPGFLDAFDALTSYPIRERLHAIQCPTLLVWGVDDRLVPVRDADVFEQLIPRAQRLIFPDTGHVPMLERPREFNEHVLAVLGE